MSEGGLDRRRRSRPTAAASTLAPYDGDRATAVTRETTTAAAAAVGSLEDPDAAGAGHSFPVGTMSSKDARHPSLSLSLSSLFALSSVSLHLPTRDCQSQTEHEFEADGTETRSGLIESPLYVYYSFGVSPLQASELRA